jgi:anthranilate synthase/aminodeoxychorismate synthase-like glutamine amidotransferase
MKTLIIDNYDSFTFNLYQLMGICGGNPLVVANDQLGVNDILKINPTHIVLSPGPGTVLKDKDFGISMEVIQKFHQTTPLLGVCLGHQGIAKAFGGKIITAPTIKHGKTSPIKHNQKDLFKDIPNPFLAMRYHSLCVTEENLPPDLIVTATALDDNVIMGLSHRQYPLFGVQFHPESFLTPVGETIILGLFIFGLQQVSMIIYNLLSGNIYYSGPPFEFFITLGMCFGAIIGSIFGCLSAFREDKKK